MIIRNWCKNQTCFYQKRLEKIEGALEDECILS